MRTPLLESIMLIGSLVVFSGPAWAQLVEEYHSPKATCCLQDVAQRLADQLQDWNQLGHYGEENGKLEADPPQPGRVVFLGDSITESWRLKSDFPTEPYVNRGIAGQTTSQMLAEVRHETVGKSPNSFRIISGNRRVYTTF